MDFPTIVFALSVILWYGQVIMDWNEQRTNLVQIDDPCYYWFPGVVDTSWPVGILNYLLVGNFLLHWDDWDNDLFVWALIPMILIRCLVLWLHPFKAHPDIIPLVDPVVEFICKTEKPRTADLSFSGHCALATLLGFLLPAWVVWYEVAAAIIGVLLIASHNHYLGDVILAPFVSFVCVAMAPWWCAVWQSCSTLLQIALSAPFAYWTLRHCYNQRCTKGFPTT